LGADKPRAFEQKWRSQTEPLEILSPLRSE
jgi:hypothetical protein